MISRRGSMDHDKWPTELESLFASYRNAVIEPEPSRDFLPELWSRIDQRRGLPYSFRRMASGFVTAAAAICLLISVGFWVPSQMPVTGGATYVEILADSEADPGLE